MRFLDRFKNSYSSFMDGEDTVYKCLHCGITYETDETCCPDCGENRFGRVSR